MASATSDAVIEAMPRSAEVEQSVPMLESRVEIAPLKISHGKELALMLPDYLP